MNMKGTMMIEAKDTGYLITIDEDTDLEWQAAIEAEADVIDVVLDWLEYDMDTKTRVMTALRLEPEPAVAETLSMKEGEEHGSEGHL